MRLNWFTPLSPAPSRSAAWLAQVLPALCTRAEVVLWTDRATGAAPPGVVVEVRRFRPGAVPWAEVHGADLSVYHLADDPDHGAAWEVSRRHPGLVVLQDAVLPRLFLGHFRRQPDGRDAYCAEMERCHGALGRWLAARVWDGRVPPDLLADCCPHLALAVGGTLGVLVHDRAAYDALRPTVPCPLAYQPGPAAWADGLLRLCAEAIRYRPRSVSYYLAARVAAELCTWAGRHAEMLSEQVAGPIVDLC